LALVFSAFLFVGNELVFTAEFPVGDEALLPLTVPITPTETGIMHFFRWKLMRTSNTLDKSHNVTISILMLYKNMFMEPFFVEPLCFSLI